MAYALLGWYAFLQAAPGVVVVHLREELHLGYTASGVHVAGFAAGSLVAGVVAPALERRISRFHLLWGGVAVMGFGALVLAAGRVPAVTASGVVVMGVGGGLLLTTVQSSLADHHGEGRTVALAEANAVASVAYLLLLGGMAMAAALAWGWRSCLLAWLVLGVVLWWTNRGLPVPSAPAVAGVDSGRLPGLFWLVLGLLFCTVAAEWCVVSWSATYVDVHTTASADTAVVVMAGYFGGVLVGRFVVSRLASRHPPAWLLAGALAVALAGFLVLEAAGTPVVAAVGLVLLGLGIGNLYPMGLALAVSVGADRAGQASALVVAVGAAAALVVPFTVGALADAITLPSAMLAVPVLLVAAVVALGILLWRMPRRSDPQAAVVRGRA